MSWSVYTHADVDQTETDVTAYDDVGQALVDDDGVYTDDTDDANDEGNADVLLMPASETATEDGFIVGYHSPFRGLRFDFAGGTAGVGGTITWQYWDGAAWQSLTGVEDGTTGFTAGTTDHQMVTWTEPNDWATQELDGGSALYHVRALVATGFATNPVADRVRVATRIGKPIRLHYATITNPGANLDYFKLWRGRASTVVPATNEPFDVVGVPAGQTIPVYLGGIDFPNGACVGATNEPGPGNTGPGTGFVVKIYFS